jgi:hypothetical protein
LCQFIFGCKKNKIDIIGVESEKTKHFYVPELGAGINSPRKVSTGK